MLAIATALLFALHENACKTVTVSKGWTIEVPKDAVELKVAPTKPEKGMRFVNRAFTDVDASYTFSMAAPTAAWDPTVRTDKALAEFVAGICHSVGPATIKFQRDLIFDGWPGLEDVILGHDGLAIYVRTYSIYGAIISVGVGYSATDGRPDTASHFISSLKHDSAIDGPVKVAGPTFTPFEPPGAGFTIGMPAASTEDDRDIAFGSQTMTSHRFMALYGNRQYYASYIAVPPDFAKLSSDDRKKMLGILIDHALRGIDPKLAATPKTVSRDGVAFESTECTTADGIGVRIDATFLGSTGYAIMMIYPSGHSGSPDIEAFFNSFKLVGS